MARKISRGFRSGVILKFRRIFRDKADQAPIFLRVEGFARHGSCGRRCFFRSLQFLRAQSGENERKAIWTAQARITIFFALSLPAVSSLTSGLRVWAPAFFICV